MTLLSKSLILLFVVLLLLFSPSVSRDNFVCQRLLMTGPFLSQETKEIISEAER